MTQETKTDLLYLALIVIVSVALGLVIAEISGIADPFIETVANRIV